MKRKVINFILSIVLLMTVSSCTQSDQGKCINPDVLATLDTFQYTKTAFETQKASDSVCVSEQSTQLQPAILQSTVVDQDQIYTESTSLPPLVGEPVSDIPDIVWSNNFETGDMTGFINYEIGAELGSYGAQGDGWYNMSTFPVRSGNFAVGLSINTNGYSNTGNYGSGLVFWGDLPEDSYYYSGWFYIPSEITPEDWWLVMEWMSSEGGVQNIYPMYALFAEDPYLKLIWRSDQVFKVEFHQNIVTIPRDTWFQIEAYYKRAQDATGQIIVWQDGVELFNVTGYPTVLVDNNVQFFLDNYTHSIEPNPCTIYVDDMVISRNRIGSEYIP